MADLRVKGPPTPRLARYVLARQLLMFNFINPAHEMAVSQVLFLRAQTMPISHNRCNHMTIGHEDRSIRLVHFPQDGAPTKVWVARSWGLPVPFLPFPERIRHCGTFRVLEAYP